MDLASHNFAETASDNQDSGISGVYYVSRRVLFGFVITVFVMIVGAYYLIKEGHEGPTTAAGCRTMEEEVQTQSVEGPCRVPPDAAPSRVNGGRDSSSGTNSPILNLGGQSFDLGGQTFFIQLIWGSKFVHSVDLGGAGRPKNLSEFNIISNHSDSLYNIHSISFGSDKNCCLQHAINFAF